MDLAILIHVCENSWRTLREYAVWEASISVGQRRRDTSAAAGLTQTPAGRDFTHLYPRLLVLEDQLTDINIGV
jgi:hypothetical protein